MAKGCLEVNDSTSTCPSQWRSTHRGHNFCLMDVGAVAEPVLHIK